MEGYKKAQLKVLMTADTVGGVWTYSMELCKALQESGVFFYLVTMGAKLSAAQRSDVEALDNVKVYETEYALEWMQEPWQDVDRSGEWLIELEKELQPDIIHLNGYAHGALPWKAPVVMVAHSDVFSWWYGVYNVYPPQEWSEYYSRVKAGISKADLLIAPSQTMMDYVSEIYEVPKTNAVIYNARDNSLFYSAEKQPYLFSMGRIWDEAKNIDLLVKAAPYIPYEIRIAGPNSFDDNNFDTSQKYINFLGKLNTDEVAQQLSQASVYVMPARYEPFGLSILEAALSGCALVLGDIDTLREIWQDNAVYVNTSDEKALSEAINMLMEDEHLRKDYAQRAYAHAQQYSIDRMAQRYMDAYTILTRMQTTIQQETIHG
jgi:glycosyltransferase involved in cell wall biosynthesis